MGTFTLSGEPPSSGVCLREVVASAWAMGRGQGRSGKDDRNLQYVGKDVSCRGCWQQVPQQEGNKCISLCIFLCV